MPTPTTPLPLARPLSIAAVAALIAISPGVSLAADSRELTVTTTADSGEGSLRAAIVRANATAGRSTVRFDTKHGPFSEPQTITLQSELPPLRGDVVVDGQVGRLWVRSGVTLSGAGKRRVLRVAPGARATIASLTIAHGKASMGGGILNEGTLVVKGVTFVQNQAEREGGAIASLRGALTLLNSTLVSNQAPAGGGLAVLGGAATVTNCTFHRNIARAGGGIRADTPLLLRNTIVANSTTGKDCVATAGVDARSTHNAIMSHDGCGTPLVTTDPLVRELGAYNGPTPTAPLGGGSPAINMGDNAAALDEDGQPLRWDQRGNGDPRFAAGYTDIGAFEVQAFPKLVVNTAVDSGLRACSGAGNGDCSLRGAIELANAANNPQASIRFDPRAFGASRLVSLARALPEVTVNLTLDARDLGGLTIRGPPPLLRASSKGRLSLEAVTLDPRR